MKYLRYFLLVVLFPIYSATYASSTPKIIQRGNLLYLANTVVVKYKNSSQSLQKPQNIEQTLDVLLKDYNLKSILRTFTNENIDAKKIGLDRIMTVEYSKDIDPFYASAKIRQLPGIEWAEPKFLRKIFYEPNDSKYNTISQWDLFKINAQAAWDISQGDTSVIIGIVDTGVDWTHPDLAANMWPGIGYDFGGLNGTPDTDPIEDHPDHGTSVAGVASAVTNNGRGISSIGYNCRLMAVKISRNDLRDNSGEPYVLYGFEGIIYAVDHGAKIINCSWGGEGHSNLEQEVINYTISKGALVVAAAGNNNLNINNYPASYDGVLSVASTEKNDTKTSFSTYGYEVDCSAPGFNIYSTWQPDTFSLGSGTSFSAPLVSGLAALVFSHFPNYTPSQVAEQIRVNSDNIDLSNPSYQYLLGYGRINAFNTLNNTNSISIRGYDIQFSDLTGRDDNFLPGDKVEIKIKFRNYLSPLNNAVISLQSLKTNASVQNGSFNTSLMNSLDSIDNSSNPFIVQIADNIHYDDTLIFKLTYNADNYSDYQFIHLIVNQSYKTENGNNISLTINSRGNLGFNDFPNNEQGDGFRFNNGSNLLFESSLMFGTSEENLSDEARNEKSGEKDTSFRVVSPIKITQPGTKAFQEGNTSFNDNGSNSGSLGITVNLHTYSFNDPENNNSIILYYKFTNTTSSDINNFYAGLFFDWDLVASSGDSDITLYDNSGNLGYVYHLNGNPDTFIGTAIISSDNYGFWAIENGNKTPFATYDGFTKAEKWETLSSGIGNPSAGPAEIAEVTSAGPFNISAGNSIDVAFTITAGKSLEELRTNVANARSKYNFITNSKNENQSLPLVFSLSQNYPNPFNSGTIINYEIPQDGMISLKIYDVLGRQVRTLINENKKAGKYSFQYSAAGVSSGVYLYQLKMNNNSLVKKLILLK